MQLYQYNIFIYLQTASIGINCFLNHSLNHILVDASIDSSIKYLQQYSRSGGQLVWVTIIVEGQMFRETFCSSCFKCYLKIWQFLFHGQIIITIFIIAIL